MKSITIGLISIFSLVGCTPRWETEIVKIKIDDTNVRLYSYSYYFASFIEFVSIEKNNREIIIYESYGVVANVYTSGRTVVIKVCQPSRQGNVETKNVPKEVYGLKIVLDTTATNDEYRFRPG